MKIVEGPTIQRYGFQNEQEPTLRAQPSCLNGPSHLMQLNGTCLKQSHEGYEYKVCPFHNVTQKEESTRWGRYYGVLGVFRDWIITNDTFVGMDYVMGESCGDINRETKVYFRCSSRTSLSNISEVEKCQYQIQFETPLACFRTAMKVQHLLSEDALIDWRKLDDWYREEDLTSKGLSNHKRSLLQGVGILYKERTIQVKEDKHVPASDSPANTMTTMNCNKLQEELDEMKDLFTQLRQTIQNNHNSTQTLSKIEHILHSNSTDW